MCQMLLPYTPKSLQNCVIPKSLSLQTAKEV